MIKFKLIGTLATRFISFGSNPTMDMTKRPWNLNFQGNARLKLKPLKGRVR